MIISAIHPVTNPTSTPTDMRIPLIPTRATLALLVVALSGCAAVHPSSGPLPEPAPPVVLDGLFDDWRGTPPAAVDGADAPGPYADLRDVRVRHDSDAVYLALTLERPLALQSMPGTLALLLDADADSATGWDLHGVPGVEAAIEFSAALGPDGARMGTGLRLMDSDGRAACVGTANLGGVMFAPSHASTAFEMRIPRDSTITFGARMNARMVSLDADGRVVDATDAFTADLRDPEPRPTPPGAGAADPLARAPGTDFRIVSWNVGREDLFRQPEAFGAILRALAPDLLLLDEVAGGHSAAKVQALLDSILPGDRPWHAVYGASGGGQRGVVATRGTAPAVAAPFAGRVPYPDSVLALVPADAPGEAHERARRRMEDGVPSMGARVEISGRRLLAVTVDLECCGAPGGPADRLRRMEALAIRATLAEALRGGGVDGVLVAGDLNLVASPDPLDLLAAGADVDGSALHVPLPLRLNGASAATWEIPDAPFTPGRLDFVLVGDAGLEVAGGFVFSAADLSPAWRARHGVDASASRATDHLPIVTDLRWRERAR